MNMHFASYKNNNEQFSIKNEETQFLHKSKFIQTDI